MLICPFFSSLEECNVATLDKSATKKEEGGCFLVKCLPLEKCKWEILDGFTSGMIIRKTVPTHSTNTDKQKSTQAPTTEVTQTSTNKGGLVTQHTKTSVSSAKSAATHSSTVKKPKPKLIEKSRSTSTTTMHSAVSSTHAGNKPVTNQMLPSTKTTTVTPLERTRPDIGGKTITGNSIVEENYN